MNKNDKQDPLECKYYRPNIICALQSDNRCDVGCAAYTRYGWRCPDFTPKKEKK